jgi:hypothetical protein
VQRAGSGSRLQFEHSEWEAQSWLRGDARLAEQAGLTTDGRAIPNTLPTAELSLNRSKKRSGRD